VPGGPAPIEQQPKQSVFTAIDPIPPRTRLTPDMFAQTDVPASEFPANAITDTSTLTNQISSGPIGRGEPLTTDKVVAGIRRVIPANFEIPVNSRAVAIWVNPDQTAAGLVDVGDRVDVVATHRFVLDAQPNTRAAGPRDVTAGRTIGQDLLVLGVDRSLNAPPPTPTPAPGAPAGAPAAPGQGAPAPAAPTPPPPPNQESRTRIILAADPEVATRLVAAQEQGKLHLMIRNPRNRGPVPVPETREYPTRVVNVPDRAAARQERQQAQQEARQERQERQALEIARIAAQASAASRPAPAIPPARVPVIPAPVPATGGVTAPANPGTLSVPEQKEVTVIRGTEKTRVIVPR
jgi:Flp pilus assembly protein CpaB